MNARPGRIEPHEPIVPIVIRQGKDVPAWVVPITDTLSMAVFDRPVAAVSSRRSTPIDGTLDGARLQRPLVSTSLPLRSGQARHVVVLRQSASSVVRDRLSLTVDGTAAAFIDPAWLQSPLREPIDLVSGITVEGTQRLLRLMLSTVPSLFGKHLGEAFSASVSQIIGLLRLPHADLGARCALGATAEVLSFRLPNPMPSLPKTVIAWSDRGFSTLPASQMMLEGDRILHVFRQTQSAPLRDLILLGDDPVRLTCPPDAGSAKPLLPWLAQRGATTARWVEELLRALASSDSAAEATLRELRLGPDTRPDVKIHLVAATQTGVLLWLDVADPHQLVTSIRIEADGSHADVLIPRSGEVRAHARFAAKVSTTASSKLRLVFGSGRISTFHQGFLDPFTGVLPPGAAAADGVAAGAALRSAWQARFASPRKVFIEDFGPQRPGLRLSLVVPATPMPDIIRARASIVASEAESKAIEVIYTLAGTPTPALGRLLLETAEVYGVAHRLVILSAQTTTPDVVLAGLAAARAPAALVTKEDVLPQGAGWAWHWIDVLTHQEGPPLVGAKLLAVDGSIEHVGGDYTWTGRSAPAQRILRARGLPEADFQSDHALLPTATLCADAVGLAHPAMRYLQSAGAMTADPIAMFDSAAHQLGACTDLDGRMVRFGTPPPIDPVIDASGRWQIADLLAATDGLEPC
jgi:hypothetical protein